MYMKTLILALVTIQIQSLDIHELEYSCNSKPINYESLIKIDNNEFSTKRPDSCKVILNATGYHSCGFLVRINTNLNQKFKQDSFSLNITDHNSKNILYQLNWTNATSENVSFAQINSTTGFEINLKDFSDKLDSIVISAFNYSTNDSCNENQLKCKYPLSTCVNSVFECNDVVKVCNDETYIDICKTTRNATSSSNPMSTTPRTLTATIFTPNLTTSFNSTDDFHLIPIQRKSINIIGLFIFLLIVISVILIAIVVYGRRKRRWREFLAQLDNNTDWEYEQLEDLPNTNGVERYSTVFDRTIESDRENQNSSRNNKLLATNNTNNNNNEQTPIANSNT